MSEPTMGQRYTCPTCGKDFVKGEDCRVFHPDKACCHEYDYTDTPPSVQEARAALDRLVQFAYETGFHELGYGPVDHLIRAVCRERDAEIRAMVEGMRDTTPRDKQTRSFYIEGFNSALADVLRLLSNGEGT